MARQQFDAWQFFKSGMIRRLQVLAAVVVFGLLAMVGRKAYMAVRYEKIPAKVERAEMLCLIGKQSILEAQDCETARTMAGKRPIKRVRALIVRYTSPADQREHVAPLISSTFTKEQDLGFAAPGSTIQMLAHKSEALTIRAQ